MIINASTHVGTMAYNLPRISEYYYIWDKDEDNNLQNLVRFNFVKPHEICLEETLQDIYELCISKRLLSYY